MPLSKAKLKYLRSLKQKKFRDQEKKFIAEGFRLVSEALSSTFAVDLVLYTADFIKKPEHAALIQSCRKQGIEGIEISAHDLDTFADTVTAQGIAAIVHQQKYGLSDLRRDSRKTQLVLALDSVSEPGNVGAIIRTGDWFGVSAVLLGAGTVELYNPKVVRSTMGSIFHLPIVTDVDLEEVLSDLRSQGFVIYATTIVGGQRYDKSPSAPKALILLGNEARGLSTALMSMADYCITIPRIGKAESLNVGVASGILLARFSVSQRA